MEFIESQPESLSKGQIESEPSLEVLKEQSSNVQRKRSATDKQQNNSTNTSSSLQPQAQNPSLTLQAPPTTNSDRIQQPLLSVDVSVIDQRDDLLLSTTTVEDHLLLEQRQSICQLHDKVEDIICLVEKKKICSYCALFGHHKDHSFKSEQQLACEADKKAKQLVELETFFSKMTNSVVQKVDLQLIRRSCEAKKREVLNELEQEYSEIVQKLKEAKNQIENKIREEDAQIIRRIELEWEQVEIDITGDRLFKEWQRCGLDVLKAFKEALKTPNVADACTSFEQFPWGKGQNLLKTISSKLEQFQQASYKEIENFSLLSNYSLKNSLATTLNLDIQSMSSLNIENQISSIQELHNINTHQTIKLQSRPSKKSDSTTIQEEKQKFRHSEFLESTLKPIRQSLQLDPRESRNSAYGLMMNKRKSQDTSKNQWNSSAVLDRLKSNSRNSQAFLSPKIKNTMCRSPRQSAIKQNPHTVLAQFQKNIAQTCLNLSNCGLEDDSLLYFVQKALSSHVPYEINLHHNTISHNGLVKLMPYLAKVQAANLASTGLSESCLQVFSKMKGPRCLEQVNLLENGISLHKNKLKIQNFRKMGLKIICQ